MPVIAHPDLSKRSRGLLWVVILLLFGSLFTLLAVAPLLRLYGRMGRFVVGAGVYPETGRPQGMSRQDDGETRDWCFRLGNWYWGLEEVLVVRSSIP